MRRGRQSLGAQVGSRKIHACMHTMHTIYRSEAGLLRGLTALPWQRSYDFRFKLNRRTWRGLVVLHGEGGHFAGCATAVPPDHADDAAPALILIWDYIIHIYVKV